MTSTKASPLNNDVSIFFLSHTLKRVYVYVCDRVYIARKKKSFSLWTSTSKDFSAWAVGQEKRSHLQILTSKPVSLCFFDISIVLLWRATHTEAQLCIEQLKKGGRATHKAAFC